MKKFLAISLILMACTPLTSLAATETKAERLHKERVEHKLKTAEKTDSKTDKRMEEAVKMRDRLDKIVKVDIETHKPPAKLQHDQARLAVAQRRVEEARREDKNSDQAVRTLKKSI